VNPVLALTPESGPRTTLEAILTSTYGKTRCMGAKLLKYGDSSLLILVGLH